MYNQVRLKDTPLKEYSLNQPGIGGLNIADVEYNLLETQSPDMLNMMYINGVLSKRYGQERVDSFDDTIYAMAKYLGDLIVHCGDKIYKYELSSKNKTEIAKDIPREKGMFMSFNKNLYYMNGKYYVYGEKKEKKPVEGGGEGETTEVTVYAWREVEPYAPDVVINRKPDGSESNTIEDYNRYGNAFKNTFNGDGTSKVYKLTDKELDEIKPKVKIDEKDVTDGFTCDYKAGTVTFTNPPSKGQNNVVITAYKTTKDTNDLLLRCRCHKTFGGQNNSRLFIAGNGKSVYYYSEVFDASYFPENNYATVGNPEEDITGFGEQYDTLIVFKPHEMCAVSYYLDKEENPKFDSKIVNSEMGCDCVNSIQLLDNRLTWLSTVFGACCLESTYIEDERNVRTISRNINGNVDRNGLLNEQDLINSKCFRFDGRYFICTPSGKCYMWDYTNTPYVKGNSPDVDAMKLGWFLFDNFYIDNVVEMDNDLFYSNGSRLCTLSKNINTDFGYKISCHYQTPILTMGVIDYFKQFKYLSVLTRGDKPNLMNIYYTTEEDDRLDEPYPIRVFGRLWKSFKYNTFGWSVIIHARTITRRMNIKKFMQLGIMFYNDDLDSNMMISVIKIGYRNMKFIR